ILGAVRRSLLAGVCDLGRSRVTGRDQRHLVGRHVHRLALAAIAGLVLADPDTAGDEDRAALEALLGQRLAGLAPDGDAVEARAVVDPLVTVLAAVVLGEGELEHRL